MAQANVDPSELRRFAHNLNTFNSDLQDSLTALHGSARPGGELARPGARQVRRGVRADHAGAHRFIEVTEEHIPFLVRKADRAEDYLRQR